MTKNVVSTFEGIKTGFSQKKNLSQYRSGKSKYQLDSFLKIDHLNVSKNNESF